MQLAETHDRFTGARTTYTHSWIKLALEANHRIDMFPLLVTEGDSRRLMVMVSYFGFGSYTSPDAPGLLEGKIILLAADRRIEASSTPTWIGRQRAFTDGWNSMSGTNAGILPHDLADFWPQMLMVGASTLGYEIGELRAFEVPLDDFTRVIDSSSLAIRISTKALVNLDFDLTGGALQSLRDFMKQAAGATFVHSAPAPSKASCFPGHAQVLVPGGQRAIRDLSRGDYILSWSESHRRLVARCITRTFEHDPAPILSVEFADGNSTLQATANHRVLAHGNEWIRVDRLVPGDRIATHDGLTRTVSSVLLSGRTDRVFNLFSEVEHNFVVEGVVVHNFSYLLGIRTWMHRLVYDHQLGLRATATQKIFARD